VLVSFRLAARRDVLAARQWYDAQAPGLGAPFATAVQEAVERLTLFPESAPMVAGKNRRILLGRFPYALYYQVQKPAISVVACLHMHRNPDLARRLT